MINICFHRIFVHIKLLHSSFITLLVHKAKLMHHHLSLCLMQKVSTKFSYAVHFFFFWHDAKYRIYDYIRSIYMFTMIMTIMIIFYCKTNMVYLQKIDKRLFFIYKRLIKLNIHYTVGFTSLLIAHKLITKKNNDVKVFNF